MFYPFNPNMPHHLIIYGLGGNVKHEPTSGYDMHREAKSLILH